MVEDKLVESAMMKFKPVLDDFKNSPTDAERLGKLQSEAYKLAHAIRDAIESAWGRNLSSPSQNHRPQPENGSDDGKGDNG